MFWLSLMVWGALLFLSQVTGVSPFFWLLINAWCLWCLARFLVQKFSRRPSQREVEPQTSTVEPDEVWTTEAYGALGYLQELGKLYMNQGLPQTEVFMAAKALWVLDMFLTGSVSNREDFADEQIENWLRGEPQQVLLSDGFTCLHLGPSVKLSAPIGNTPVSLSVRRRWSEIERSLLHHRARSVF